MSGMWGNNIKLSIFGESHGNAIGINIDNLPPGFPLDMEEIMREMRRRAPGKNNLSTARKESDVPEILSGYFEGKTTGTPLCAIIRNSDNKSKDYSKIKDVMRPGHGDYPGFVKYKGFNDYRGGGHFSGRITAPLVFVGAICKQILRKSGIEIVAHIKSIGDMEDKSFLDCDLDKLFINSLKYEEFPLIKKNLEEKMKNEILSARKEGDSVGGIIECMVLGIKAGIGSPFFDSVESTLAHLIFSVPAVKGVEFGMGFDISKMKGSKSNDEYYLKEGKVKTKTNNNGGIIGGITNGMPIIFRVAIKPTPSVYKEQNSINISTMEETTLQIEGRHDPCIVQRAVPVIEGVSAVGILDLIKNS
ncbi:MULTISPECIES: chorismate synthase [Terrisporobacter]|uniref:Chorismate synthase n=1 Tax=Terrisporobacter muris TaxID=2963284 RepID=A0A9X2M8R0_9FIRM|nr:MULTISPECIES: chorismate synthase [Terrisporobacter]MCR1822050.1 chorismate synthase [Terrisporobacter muris]MDY3372955.1 chorismate synthase [Terrisporobacter othiniensis]